MFVVVGWRGVPLPHQADDEGGEDRRTVSVASGLWVGGTQSHTISTQLVIWVIIMANISGQFDNDRTQVGRLAPGLWGLLVARFFV